MKKSTYIADDGDEVKSRAELVIDNFLTSNQIKHEYEKKITINGKILSPDWYLPDCDAYIEFWGMESNQNYSEKQLKKLKVYAKSDLRVLSLNNPHLENGPYMAKTILGFIEDIQNKIKEKERLDRIEEVKKQEEINQVRADTEAKIVERERLARIEEKRKEGKANRDRARVEAKKKEDEENDELAKILESAITWTIAGVKTGIDSLFKSKRKKAP
ncbi:MAG: hypothetical protein GPJ54_19640, partial [Candidatus Heimdallarchaeota archaeon]|nr:hypothetical protein [Candidatus Heimdallarchaeota archaeon]